MDEGQVNAVGARIEIDLRLGAVFTRFQTLTLQLMGGDLSDRMISYGSYLGGLKYLTFGLIFVKDLASSPLLGLL